MNPELPGQAEPPEPFRVAGQPTPHGVLHGVHGDLAGSLRALSRLSAAEFSLESLLTQVASFAVRAIPGADGAGLTLREPDRSDTTVKSETFVREIEEIQYGTCEGPCLTAAATGQTMRSGSLSDDPRWPRFGPGIAALGVHSVLALPLLTAGGVIGAINVYAHPRDAFDDHAEHIGQLFAEPAVIAVQNAQILRQTRRLVRNLQAALTSRAIIDQAIGIIISRTGVTAEEAFERIRRRSQAEHLKVSAMPSRSLTWPPTATAPGVTNRAPPSTRPVSSRPVHSLTGRPTSAPAQMLSVTVSVEPKIGRQPGHPTDGTRLPVPSPTVTPGVGVTPVRWRVEPQVAEARQRRDLGRQRGDPRGWFASNHEPDPPLGAENVGLPGTSLP